jgi:hypothetical protein
VHAPPLLSRTCSRWPLARPPHSTSPTPLPPSRPRPALELLPKLVPPQRLHSAAHHCYSDRQLPDPTPAKAGIHLPTTAGSMLTPPFNTILPVLTSI